MPLAGEGTQMIKGVGSLGKCEIGETAEKPKRDKVPHIERLSLKNGPRPRSLGNAERLSRPANPTRSSSMSFVGKRSPTQPPWNKRWVLRIAHSSPSLVFRCPMPTPASSCPRGRRPPQRPKTVRPGGSLSWAASGSRKYRDCLTLRAAGTDQRRYARVRLGETRHPQYLSNYPTATDIHFVTSAEH